MLRFLACLCVTLSILSACSAEFNAEDSAVVAEREHAFERLLIRISNSTEPGELALSIAMGEHFPSYPSATDTGEKARRWELSNPGGADARLLASLSCNQHAGSTLRATRTMNGFCSALSPKERSRRELPGLLNLPLRMSEADSEASSGSPREHHV